MPQGKSLEARARALQGVYEQLPVMHCEGLCADSCFSLGQTRTEQQVIQVSTGVRVPLTFAAMPCPALTMLRRCGVYEVRPMICRIWGMTGALRCQYGCTPEGGFLTDRQAYEFLAQVAEIDGDLEAAERFRAPFRQDPDAASPGAARNAEEAGPGVAGGGCPAGGQVHRRAGTFGQETSGSVTGVLFGRGAG